MAHLLKFGIIRAGWSFDEAQAYTTVIKERRRGSRTF
jgi:hypothetical protein